MAKPITSTCLLVDYPPTLARSRLANLLKGTTARQLRVEFGTAVRAQLWGKHFWSGSYYATSAGGAPLRVLKAHIEQQRRLA